MKRRVVLQPDARRQQLLTAATTVFAARGFRAAGVSDIVSTAGVARGTFYLYFEGKAQVFLAIADDFYDGLELAIAHAGASLDSPPPGAPGVPGVNDGWFLRATCRRWLEFFHRHRLAAAVMLKEGAAIDPRFERAIAELRQSARVQLAERFRRSQQLGLVRSSLSPDFVARLQVGMFEELVKSFVLDAAEPDLDALADQMADFEWSGVRPATR